MVSCKTKAYRILRFWNNEVLENLDGVHEMIAGELGGITPTQTPGTLALAGGPSGGSPVKGGGLLE